MNGAIGGGMGGDINGSPVLIKSATVMKGSTMLNSISKSEPTFTAEGCE